MLNMHIQYEFVSWSQEIRMFLVYCLFIYFRSVWGLPFSTQLYFTGDFPCHFKGKTIKINKSPDLPSPQNLRYLNFKPEQQIINIHAGLRLSSFMQVLTFNTPSNPEPFESGF